MDLSIIIITIALLAITVVPFLVITYINNKKQNKQDDSKPSDK